MKIIIALSVVLLASCTTLPHQQSETAAISCEGSITLPTSWQPYFAPVAEPSEAQTSMLERALGEPLAGKLCQGRLYTLTQPATAPLYRVWNSTNPNSRLGQWWAFDRPAGKVAAYREAYEICYQWSPLDKLVQCDLQSGATVVIGTGQSATCSQYLAYPTSAALQIYIEDAGEHMQRCTDADAVFAWE